MDWWKASWKSIKKVHLFESIENCGLCSVLHAAVTWTLFNAYLLLCAHQDLASDPSASLFERAIVIWDGQKNDHFGPYYTIWAILDNFGQVLLLKKKGGNFEILAKSLAHASLWHQPHALNYAQSRVPSLPLSCTSFGFYWLEEVNRSIRNLQNWSNNILEQSIGTTRPACERSRVQVPTWPGIFFFHLRDSWLSGFLRTVHMFLMFWCTMGVSFSPLKPGKIKLCNALFYKAIMIVTHLVSYGIRHTQEINFFYNTYMIDNIIYIHYTNFTYISNSKLQFA